MKHTPTIEGPDAWGHFSVNCGYYGVFAHYSEMRGGWVVDTWSSDRRDAERVLEIADVISKAVGDDNVRVRVIFNGDDTVTLMKYDWNSPLGTYSIKKR